MDQPKFIPQQTIQMHNDKTFGDWKRTANSKAAMGAIMISVAQNKNAGQLLFAAADDVQIGYAINILRSCADQLEAQLEKKVKEQNDQVVKRLSWHRRIWQKIWPTKAPVEVETKLQGTEAGADVVEMAKRN